MRRVGFTALIACAGLAGAPSLSGAGLFSATGPVIAIMAGDLFVGEAEGHLNGAGTLAIRAQKNAALTCVGEFTSSAARGGSGQMQCSDGTHATFLFQRLSLRSGHGAGSSSRGPISFTYGLTAEEAGPYLKLPAGKKLAHSGTALELVDL